MLSFKYLKNNLNHARKMAKESTDSNLVLLRKYAEELGYYDLVNLYQRELEERNSKFKEL